VSGEVSEAPRKAGHPASTVWQDGWWRWARQVRSPNHDARGVNEPVSLIVIHSISLPPGVFGGGAVEDLFLNRLDPTAHPYYEGLRGLRVSSHFFVRRDGEVVQFASCAARAWHAGVSQWRGRAQCNDFSVGIELEGLEGERFEDNQYASLSRLVRALAKQWPIDGIAGHEHVAPGRKKDPGEGFDWVRLKRQARVPWRWFDAQHALSLKPHRRQHA
jgi:N-acetyl-anhydromuramoyl-L-alanine amidase